MLVYTTQMSLLRGLENYLKLSFETDRAGIYLLSYMYTIQLVTRMSVNVNASLQEGTMFQFHFFDGLKSNIEPTF